MPQVSFRIDTNTKNSAEKALKEMGLTMSAAITMFLVKVGREKRIPFEINSDPFYSDAIEHRRCENHGHENYDHENIAVIKNNKIEKRIKDIENGTSVLK